MNRSERSTPSAAGNAHLAREATFAECSRPTGQYTARLLRPVTGLMPQVRAMLRELDLALRAGQSARAEALQVALRLVPRTEVWRESFANLVTNQGATDMLQQYLAGVGYTAAWYCGLISSIGYVGVAAGDTAAEINGTNAWKEAATANAPDYSQTTRPPFVFAAAAGRSIATAAEVVYTIASDGTVKGLFAASSPVKDGITGILYSAGLFTGGDKTVQTGDTLNVSYSSTLT